MNPVVNRQSAVYIGMDPELFLRDDKGNIVPSDQLVPEKGMHVWGGYGKLEVVRDGVQVELHPRPHMCRANLGNELTGIIRGLIGKAAAKGLKVDFTQTIEIPKKQFDKLPMPSKQLGCMPSLNVYDKNPTIKVNPNTYRKRSAGGHIHIGIDKRYVKTPEEAPNFVKLLDLFLGIPSVLIDRDPNAAIRRRNYGRAGEYRLPKHGIEYRTLSNYWMRDYRLMSFVTGMARLVHELFVSSKITTGDLITSKIIKEVNWKAVRKAINTNDVELARKIWKTASGYIKTYIVSNLDSGLWAGSLPQFEHFIKRIDEEGLDYWFPISKTEERWKAQTEGHGSGWENFLIYNVARDEKLNNMKGARSKVKAIEDRINARLRGKA